MSTSPAGAVAIIEDDEAMRRAIRRVLETEGFVTEDFETAEAFLASRAASRVQCLVLDIRLPGMSGIDLNRHLRSMGVALPTVFITANEDPRARQQALKAAKYYLVKPFLGETLIEAVSRSIGRLPTTGNGGA